MERHSVNASYRLSIEYLSSNPPLAVVVRHSKENTGGGHGRREKGMFSLTGIRNRAYRLFVTYRQVIVKITPQRLCGNKLPTRCNRGFYCRSYCLLNMFRASPCPSSGAQEYYTVVAACGILCCGFSSSWSGVELRVMCPVCRMLVHCLCFVACMVWVTDLQ